MEGEGREFIFHRDAEFFSLLLQKRACACRTCLVHFKVDNNAVFYRNIFRVLPADLKDCVDGRVDKNRRGGLGRDLVLDNIGAHVIGDHISSRAGGAHSKDVDSVPHFRIKLLETLPDSIYRPSGSHEISLAKERAMLVNQSKIRAYRAYVYTHINACSPACTCRGLPVLSI